MNTHTLFSSLEASIVLMDNHPLQLSRGALWTDCARALCRPRTAWHSFLARTGLRRQAFQFSTFSTIPPPPWLAKGLIQWSFSRQSAFRIPQDLTCPCLLPHPQWNSRSPSQSGWTFLPRFPRLEYPCPPFKNRALS